MLVLAVDSSTKVGSVSLVSTERLVAESLLNLDQTHSQRLMPQIVELVKRSDYELQDVDGIAVGLGPGSFTGTRIGVVTAKTLAQSLELPIVGISTLKAMAYNLKYVSGYICPVVDARRERVFTGLYRTDGEDLRAETEEGLLAIDDLITELSSIQEEIYFVGEIAQKYRTEISEQVEQAQFVSNKFSLPQAGALGELAVERLMLEDEDQLFELTPNYLKRSQAEIQWEDNN
ncbi:tRNA (adenosine(37)-N6)-threonylcarbamoyltransferase complex dimerization subunit type 1 TsaB [Natroniella sulfidigena]|uniref:tRNA (adenosine(37)-N6)-threonylcarbamoyltransferase complex dimerization subunit type 1 TsaB n=1 Tax=Natroniella sulfidigena TaxID=723921 RepID=UPI00200AABB4|nr:tRNA (adenosine(37)-N6)-threonylcarbamoyltransferase complex dimerization subunit type 1 TsaB [Natroniella sulfidigena]MCK8816135.1 tRNA (adenosine(37)-N6)-threonylcarbamoyltransferase complex dimerization subunit type 1 TsaB [Natroniella sulfidigena]